jgi:hypothetical protein
MPSTFANPLVNQSFLIKSNTFTLNKSFFLDTDDYARVALPTGDFIDLNTESNGDTSDGESGGESEENHGDRLSLASIEIL